MELQWSKYQKAIFEDIAEGTGNTVIEARAGSAKTTTIVKGVEYIPVWDSWLLCAFNKRIAAELKSRVNNKDGDIRTLHSLGLKAIKKRFNNVDLDNNKVWNILDRLVGKDRKWNDIKHQLKKTISLCKGCLIDGPENIDFLLDEFDIDVLNMDRSEFINIVSKSLLKSFEDNETIDFDDMIWFPNVYDMKVGDYKKIFIDECQDLNPCQTELALKAVGSDGRITVVGDSKQAIYNFTGAACDSLDKLSKRLNAKVLTLPITYRCPLKVVKYAKQFAPDIQAKPNAPEGVLEYISSKEMMKMAKPGCFILSRVNAPLIGIALKFISNDVPCNIQGRDIGSNLISVIKKSKKKTIPAFLGWLETWERKEVDRMLKSNRSPVSIRDKAGCLRTLADSCTSVAEMKGKIQDLFEDGDDYNRVILSSVHKSKGLERNTVFVLSSTFFGGNQEEKNIKYVAATRAKESLYFVTDGNYGSKNKRKAKKSI